MLNTLHVHNKITPKQLWGKGGLFILSEKGTLDIQLSFMQCRASDRCSSLCPHFCSFKNEFSVYKN